MQMSASAGRAARSAAPRPPRVPPTISCVLLIQLRIDNELTKTKTDRLNQPLKNAARLVAIDVKLMEVLR